MEIKLYITTDSDTTINKTLDEVARFNIELRDIQDVIAPVLLLGAIEGVDLKTVNYARIDAFERFYFVRSVAVGPDNIYTLSLEVDVIETYKEDILNAQAEISRKIEDNDFRMISSVPEVRKETDIHYSNKSLGLETSIIFSTIGQEMVF